MVKQNDQLYMKLRHLPMEWFQLSDGSANAIRALLNLLEVIAILIAAWSIVQQGKQLQRVKQQIALQTTQVQMQGERIFISSFSVFSNMYRELVASMPSKERVANAPEINAWWYQYFSILAAEVMACARGHLDPTLFEMWILEMCRNYTTPPFGASYMGTIKERLDIYLGESLPDQSQVGVFFTQIQAISALPNDKQSQAVRGLIDATYKSMKQPTWPPVPDSA